MHRIDHDLLSVQEARILVENAREAQKLLMLFPQAKLDAIVAAMAAAVRPQAEALARASQVETGFGRWEDKYIKNVFASEFLAKRLQAMNVVGIIDEDEVQKTIDIGVPVGVVVAVVPATNPVSTTIYKALIAIKSGNALVVAPHPRARQVVGKVMELLIRAAEQAGLPNGALSWLQTLAIDGTKALMQHRDTAMILLTGVPKLLKAAQCSGKPTIYGGPGNGPAFIERSADIAKAVADIIASRTFDNGIVSASEQSIVAEAAVADAVRQELKRSGAYFLSADESRQLGQLFFRADGSINPESVGRTACQLAQEAGFSVPEGTTVLLSEQQYVAPDNPYAREKLCPVLAFFVEQDWRYACEKCIELLLNEGRGHTLVIHSQNEAVIREFALKKPVSRVLVNTPSTLGGIGATTNLFPAFTLGCGAAGGGVTSDNVTPRHLINIRKVGYGVRRLQDIVAVPAETASPAAAPEKNTTDLQELMATLLQQLAAARAQTR